MSVDIDRISHILIGNLKLMSDAMWLT